MNLPNDAEKAQLNKMNFTPPLFVNYMQPNGGLTRDRETHALFYYYLLAKKNLETRETQLVYEGDTDPVFAFRNLFKSIAILYGVRPEHMQKCWPEVDYTCHLNNLPKFPKGNAYRYPRIGDKGTGDATNDFTS